MNDYKNDLDAKLKLLGENVRKLRKERQMTLKQLSSETGISTKYLQKIEDGQAERLIFKHFDRLCNVFNLNSLKELLIF